MRSSRRRLLSHYIIWRRATGATGATRDQQTDSQTPIQKLQVQLDQRDEDEGLAESVTMNSDVMGRDMKWRKKNKKQLEFRHGSGLSQPGSSESTGRNWGVCVSVSLSRSSSVFPARARASCSMSQNRLCARVFVKQMAANERRCICEMNASVCSLRVEARVPMDTWSLRGFVNLREKQLLENVWKSQNYTSHWKSVDLLLDLKLFFF